MDERREQLRSIAQSAAATANKKLGDLWWFFMLRGVLAAILGICALFWPSRSLAILITLVGVFILADGVTGLAGALRNWTGSETLLQPVVSMVIGPVLLVWPGASVGLLMVVLGVWAWIYGVSQILEARKPSQGKRRPRFNIFSRRHRFRNWCSFVKPRGSHRFKFSLMDTKGIKTTNVGFVAGSCRGFCYF